MKRLTLSLVLALLICPMSRALAVSESGVLFLRISPDARSTGMGETAVAIVDGAMATAWNPGALGYADHKELTFTYFKWLPELADDLYYLYFSYVQPVKGLGTIGISVPYLSLGEQTRTNEIGDELGNFSSFDVAVVLSYGTKIANVLAVGSNVKIIRSNLSNVGAGAEVGKGIATTFAVDAGAMYRIHRRLTLAGVVQNLGPKVTYIDADQADPLPRNLKVGFALKALDGKYNRLTIASDFNKSLVTKQTVSSLSESVWNVGGEYWYANFIALRTGAIADMAGKINSNGKRAMTLTPTFGGGLQWRTYRFDFSYMTGGSNAVLQNITKFSITAGF
ncbi:MAG: PorV/PorQ family protein [Candidatus Latescibacteria bacterium]|nr:PorV/PorQ family protein [Candidatus Latescibacterota bacterium]